jgi:hypothetical protein
MITSILFFNFVNVFLFFRANFWHLTPVHWLSSLMIFLIWCWAMSFFLLQRGILAYRGLSHWWGVRVNSSSIPYCFFVSYLLEGPSCTYGTMFLSNQSSRWIVIVFSKLSSFVEIRGRIFTWFRRIAIIFLSQLEHFFKTTADIFCSTFYT